MARDGSGVYTRPFTFVDDKANLVALSAERFDAALDDIAVALNDVATDEEIGTKANVSDVNSALALKADASAVTTLSTTVSGHTTSIAALTTAVAGKADTATVNNALAAKADESTVNTELAQKLDVTAVGAANGAASLDSTLHVPYTQIPIDFASAQDAISASINASQNWLRTAGYNAQGDRGHALYKRGAGATTGGIRTADGSYWDLVVGRETNAECFGVLTGGTSSANVTALQAAIDYMTARGGGTLRLWSPSSYSFAAGVTHKPGVTLDLGAETTLTYTAATGDFITILPTNGDRCAVTGRGLITASNASTGWAISANSSASGDTASDVRVDGIRVTGFLKGIRVVNGTRPSIRPGSLTGQGSGVAGGIGIQIGDGTNNGTFAVAAGRVTGYATGIRTYVTGALLDRPVLASNGTDLDIQAACYIASLDAGTTPTYASTTIEASCVLINTSLGSVKAGHTSLVNGSVVASDKDGTGSLKAGKNAAKQALVTHDTAAGTVYEDYTWDDATALRVHRMRTAGSAVTTFTEKADGTVEFAKSAVSKSPSAGVGYSTGAGGAVSQLTSISTAVTLNTMTGQITTQNNGLGAANAVQTFTVNNSSVLATDCIHVWHRGGANFNSYLIRATNIRAGAFDISIKNVDSVGRNENMVIGFLILRAVTS